MNNRSAFCSLLLSTFLCQFVLGQSSLEQFLGADPGVSSSASLPNSDEARTMFLAAADLIGAVTTIDFESLLADNSIDVEMPIALDSVLTLSGSDGYSLRISDGNSMMNQFDGFATSGEQALWSTSFGDNFRTLTFDFSEPVNSFGLFISGQGTAGGSELNLQFDDGQMQTFNLNGGLGGGAFYFGVTNFGTSFNQLTITQDNAGDGFRIDDVSFGVAAILGDVNLDDVVDFFDISPFIEVLASEGFQAEADIDGNGVVDFFDIQPFIQLLSGQ